MFCSGRIELSEYTGQEGTARTSHELTADDVYLLGPRGEDRSFGTAVRPGAPVQVGELPF